jgi:uncharacterized protein YyaL (SSP411 family)
MIAGFAEAGRALGEPGYVATAARAADFVLKHQLTKGGRLLRTYAAPPGKAPEAQGAAYLEDYAFLVHGLLALHEATGEASWLDRARSLTDTMMRDYGDPKAGGYYFTANDAEKLFARSKDQYDGATPSGNSMALYNLVRLWKRTGAERYRAEADKGFKAFAGHLKMSPGSLTTMAAALDLYLDAREAAGQAELRVKELGPVRKADKGPEPVRVEVRADKPGADGKQVLTITLTIDKGWHVYANPVGNDNLGPAATTVEVSGKGKVTARVTYPPGRPVKDAVVGNYNAYEGQVTLTATVRRTPGDGPLEVSVRYQACDDRRCLPPATVKRLVAE